MTAKERAALLRQAGRLYTLGLTVEKRRQKLHRLVEKKVPYDSLEMHTALVEFQTVNNEWKRLEQEHLQYKAEFVTESNILSRK